MKKKVYISLVIIALVGGLGYAATQAFFTARETATGSTFTVGTLDLSVNDDKDVIEPFIVAGIGASGNISGGKEWTVKNIGTLPGRLFFSLADLTNLENGCNKPEKQLEPECEADNLGELGSVITANVSVDGTPYVSSTLETANEGVFGSTWRTQPMLSSLPVVLPLSEWNGTPLKPITTTASKVIVWLLPPTSIWSN